MERIAVVLAVAAALALAWVAWQGIKIWLRRRVRVGDEILADGRPALIYFHSPACAPCHLQQRPIVNALQKAMGDQVRFEAHDVVDRPDLSRRYQVLTVPTTVVIGRDGAVVAINYGVTQAQDLERQLGLAGA